MRRDLAPARPEAIYYLGSVGLMELEAVGSEGVGGMRGIWNTGAEVSAKHR